MSKHKKWQIEDCDKGIWVETADEIDICRVLRGGSWTLVEARNHARLIAAAPDLINALEVILRDYMAVHDIGDLEMQPALYQARAAIAKATGELA